MSNIELISDYEAKIERLEPVGVARIAQPDTDFSSQMVGPENTRRHRHAIRSVVEAIRNAGVHVLLQKLTDRSAILRYCSQPKNITHDTSFRNADSATEWTFPWRKNPNTILYFDDSRLQHRAVYVDEAGNLKVPLDWHRDDCEEEVLTALYVWDSQKKVTQIPIPKMKAL